MTGKLYRGDNLAVLPTLPQDSVQLVVTSPPYNVGYGYADDGENDSLPLPLYLERLGRTLLHVSRVLREGGVLALNLPSTIRTANHRAYPLAAVVQTTILMPMGWLLREPVVWVKTSDGSTPVTASTAFGGPTNPFMRPCHEMILLASKGTYRVAGKEEWGLDNYVEACKDTWMLPPGRRRAEGLPPEFPPSLVANCVGLFSSPGDVVLDPWAGYGTTGTVARMNGREAWLIEREPTYWPRLETVVGQEILPGVA